MSTQGMGSAGAVSKRPAMFAHHWYLLLNSVFKRPAMFAHPHSLLTARDAFKTNFDRTKDSSCCPGLFTANKVTLTKPRLSVTPKCGSRHPDAFDNLPVPTLSCLPFDALLQVAVDADLCVDHALAWLIHAWPVHD